MNRRAFTLIELLVVIAIIGVLIGLTLSAVQQVRAAAARLVCASRLQQIGLALHNHHSGLGRFPSGRGTPLPRIFSPHAYLLPFLEQDAIQARIDFDAAPAAFTVPPSTVYDGVRNAEAATSSVKMFVCPSDRSNGSVPGSAFGATNYAANAGSGSNGGSLTQAGGVFFLGSAVRLTDIADGSSTTAAFSERTLGGLDAGRRMRELPGGTDPTAMACDGSGVWNDERGAKWIVGNYGNTLYNHAMPPNAPSWDCLNATQQKARMSARSSHAGGVNVLFCDGGVRFVRDGVAGGVWRATATRAGGELEQVID